MHSRTRRASRRPRRAVRWKGAVACDLLLLVAPSVGFFRSCSSISASRCVHFFSSSLARGSRASPIVVVDVVLRSSYRARAALVPILRCRSRPQLSGHTGTSAALQATRWRSFMGRFAVRRSGCVHIIGLTIVQRPSSDRGDHHPARKCIAAHPSLARQRCRRVVRRGERDGLFWAPTDASREIYRIRYVHGPLLLRTSRSSSSFSLGRLALDEESLFDAIRSPPRISACSSPASPRRGFDLGEADVGCVWTGNAPVTTAIMFVMYVAICCCVVSRRLLAPRHACRVFGIIAVIECPSPSSCTGRISLHQLPTVLRAGGSPR